jgi:hypothetical protein
VPSDDLTEALPLLTFAISIECVEKTATRYIFRYIPNIRQRSRQS